MWGNKKPEPTAKPASTPAVTVGEEAPKAPAPVPPPVEVKPMAVNEAPRPAGTTPARLGSSLHVKGEITGNEDLLVDGSVEGLISLEDRKLTVGPTAKLAADVVAREIVVHGTVKGNLRARDRIEIKKEGSVVGDLTTARISIDDGAYFKGSIEIDRGGEADADVDRPAFSRAANKSGD